MNVDKCPYSLPAEKISTHLLCLVCETETFNIILIVKFCFCYCFN